MAKYYLVASYYNRNKQVYLNETVVNFDDVDLSSLQKIDAFTSGTGKYGILNRLDREFGLSNVNHLAVKYYKNKNAEPCYYRMMDTNLEFQRVAMSAKNSKEYHACMVNFEDDFFLNELRNLLDLLNNGNMDKFCEYYSYRDELFLLVSKYYHYYDEHNMEDMAEKNRILKLIKLEFSKYKTFRGWITLKEKRKQVYGVQNSRREFDNNVNDHEEREKIVPKSIEENEEEYEKNFEDVNKISWKQAQTISHNLANLDKEEFLEESEMDMMYEENNVRKMKR